MPAEHAGSSPGGQGKAVPVEETAVQPDVVDRVVCEAVRQVLEPLLEPTFHSSSHGFRPGRSCRTAVAEAKRHLEDGYGWCVDLDLEKFFDLVCHQRLSPSSLSEWAIGGCSC